MKKIITLLLSLIFITSCIPIMADTPALYKQLLVNDDFTSGTVGTNNGGNDNYIYSDAEGNSNRMLYLDAKTYVEYRNNFFAGSAYKNDRYTIEFDVYFPETRSEFILYVRNNTDGDKGEITKFIAINKSEILCCGTKIYDIPSPKQHYRVKLDIDLSGSTDVIDIYLDNSTTPTVNNATTSTNISRFDRIRLQNHGAGSSPCVIVDNLLAYGIKEGPSFASTVAQPAYNAEKIDFTLAGNVVYSTLTTDTVKLVCSDGDIPLDKVVTSAAGGTLSVYPKYNLDADTSYTVTIQNGKTNVEVFAGQPLTQAVSYTFTTLPENRGVSNSTWVPSSGEITFEANLSSANEGDDICVILTLWDGNKLVGVKAVKYTHVQISSGDNAAVTITGAVAGNKVKAMVVDNFDNPTRVGKPIYEYVVN